MIYEYIPHKDTKQATGLIAVLIAAAVGFFIFPSVFPQMQMRWGCQLTGALCLVAVIFVYTRYVGRSYIYRIVDENDELELTVTEITGGGRSRVTVCRFALDAIEEAYALTPADDGKKKLLMARAKGERRKRFDYCPQLSAPLETYLFVRVGGEALFVKLAADERLFSYFHNSEE